MKRRVFLRGMGAYSSFSSDWPGTAEALREGKGAIAEVKRFDVRGYPCTVAASIDEVSESARCPDRRIVFALSAAKEALHNSRLRAPSSRWGVFIGAESGRTGFGTLLQLAAAAGGGSVFDHRAFGEKARPMAGKEQSLVASPSAVAGAIAKEIGAQGPVATLSLACASGSAAIAEAIRSIRLGICDAALCGGVGADVDPLMFAAFGLLGALSLAGVSRPFDAHRDGFVLGEGAAMAVLSAEQGDATIELAGMGSSLDAYHLTAPDPSGEGAFRAMKAALLDAGAPCVDYIQAHGTSTLLNDAVEAAAIRRIFGDNLEKVHISSVKGALGHWIAGAGALGMHCAADAIMSGYIMPTVGLNTVDAACELPLVKQNSIKKDVKTALVNSFGFGGANCSLVLRSLV